jgi:hypothetical protein
MKCSNCKNQVKYGDDFCSKCGARLIWPKNGKQAEVILDDDNNKTKGNTNIDHLIPPENPIKMKSAAVGISFVFGAFGWIYTWGKDWWKLVISIVITTILALTIGDFAFFIGICFGLWPIIQNAVRPWQFFAYYPKGDEYIS